MNQIAPTILAAAVLVVLSTTQSTVASAQNAATNSATVACAPQTDQEKRAWWFRDDFIELQTLNFYEAWARGIGAALHNDTWSRKCAPVAVQSARAINEGQGPQGATAAQTAR